MKYPPHLIRVSDVLSESGLVDVSGPWYTPEARDRGTAVHRATELLDDGELDWGSLDPVVYAKTKSYERFVEEMRPEILSVEHYGECGEMGYCGTLDRIVRINGSVGVLDIKPTPAKWHALQLAGYKHLWNTTQAKKAVKTWALYLSPNGTYKLDPYSGRSYWLTFLGALTVAKWKRANQ